MRLFVSYARVDKPVCRQVAEVLDVHDVWYDHRLHAGQKWWDEILRRLAWCDGFIYLLSHESVTSEYCQREFAIAQQLNKHIFPVLIHKNTTIPEALNNIQYADLSDGFDAQSVKHLLNAIYIREREGNRNGQSPAAKLGQDLIRPPDVEPAVIIAEAAAALDEGNFDRAVFLLKRAREIGYESRFVDISVVLRDAEAALERQTTMREAEREYKAISALLKYKSTFQVGCDAFKTFHEHFRDYDPECLAAICLAQTIPTIDWCVIPPGEVGMDRAGRHIIYQLDQYRISKYPVTNEQYQLFIDALDGYRSPNWWSFSPDASAWHEAHLAPLPSQFEGGEYPRTNVCWYEAVAFCFWLSEKLGCKITLPNEQQWQRAAQGEQDYRYPWGNKFDSRRCNTKEAGLKTTTPVGQYPDGVSPFGVYDMAGNVWEWCLNKHTVESPESSGKLKINYAVRGGSYLGTQERAQNAFCFTLLPVHRYFTIGFRVVTSD